jgi:hypothetical protein
MYIAMINRSPKGYLWWLEWIIVGKDDIQQKSAPFVGSIDGAFDGCFPMKDIFLVKLRVIR